MKFDKKFLAVSLAATLVFGISIPSVVTQADVQIPESGVYVDGSTTTPNKMVRVYASDGTALIPGFYKSGITPTMSYEGMTNTFSNKGADVTLADGDGYYLAVKSENRTKTFGPFSFDNTNPSIKFELKGDKIEYALDDKNLDLENSVYNFSDSTTVTTGEKFSTATGTLENKDGKRYLNVLIKDTAGNEITKSYDFGNFTDAVKFSNNSNTVTVTLDNSIVPTKSSYKIFEVGASIPITSGSFSSNNLSWNFPTSGNYYVEVTAVNTNGISKTITSQNLSGSNRDTVKPTVSVDSDGDEVTIKLSDTSGIDFSKSYYRMNNKQYNITKDSFIISVDDYTLQKGLMVVYDKSGNKTEKVFDIKYLPKGLVADLQLNGKYMELVWGVEPTNWKLSKDWDKIDNLTYEYKLSDGSDEFDFKLDSKNYFTVVIDNSFSTLLGSQTTVEWELSKDLKELELALKNTASNDIVLSDSYYRVDGGKKTYLKKEKTTIDLTDYTNPKEVELNLVDKSGNSTKYTKTLVATVNSTTNPTDPKAYANFTYLQSSNVIEVRLVDNSKQSVSTLDIFRANGEALQRGVAFTKNPLNVAVGANKDFYFVVNTTKADGSKISIKSGVTSATTLANVANSQILETSTTNVPTGYVVSSKTITEFLEANLTGLNIDFKPRASVVGIPTIQFKDSAGNNIGTINSAVSGLKFPTGNYTAVLNWETVGKTYLAQLGEVKDGNMLNLLTQIKVYEKVNSITSPTNPTPNPNPSPINPPVISDKGVSFAGYVAYITGYKDGSFRPANQVTRAEFAQMLHTVLVGGNVSSNISYSDVRQGDWFYPAINRLSSLGIAFSDGSNFRPNDPITRAEAAAWLNRVGLNPVVDNGVSLSDISGHSLANDIQQAASKKLIFGYTDGTFKPANKISRVESVVMINRMLGRQSGADSFNSQTVMLPPDMTLNQWGYYDVVDSMNSHSVTGKTAQGFDKW